MSNLTLRAEGLKFESKASDSSFASTITRSASKQTYYTIHLLADRDRVADAYRAYAYFRWVDDQLDQSGITKRERLYFVGRQLTLMERCYRGEWPRRASDEEMMLVQLIRSERGERSGLRSYIHHMMAVMAFDAERRGRLISADELDDYTRNLATAVTEAMHYFIGHRCKSPQDETRYLAVSAAHITHMLRDTLDDIETGYFNIPSEIVEANHVDPRDVESEPYRKWIKDRVGLARVWFKTGRRYLSRVENLRCRIAGFAYTARFESVLSAIESDDYRLRRAYPECKSFMSTLNMGWSATSRALIPQ
ncbi:MAG: squalene/phytoene synthase family protein [Chloroflexi bacterium]|nr:squalene/phytoene synthase family protein [Chloroflexota bacterium]